MKLNGIIDLSKNNVLFCSDLHYNHSNILKMNDTRNEWSSVSEMNTWIEDNVWKSLNPGDILFDLGDTFWKMSDDKIRNILSNIPKGVELHKVIGNHDPFGLFNLAKGSLKDYYKTISDILDITVRYEGKDYMITLCHYPLVSWNHKPYGSFMLHGHCHGYIDSFNNSTPDLRLDIGMDGELCQKLKKPILSFQDILDYFEEKVGNSDFEKFVKSNKFNL